MQDNFLLDPRKAMRVGPVERINEKKIPYSRRCKICDWGQENPFPEALAEASWTKSLF